MLFSVNLFAESPVPEFRTWTSQDGKHSNEARFLVYSNGNVYLQRKSDERYLRISLLHLCEKDRKYLEAFDVPNPEAGEGEIVRKFVFREKSLCDTNADFSVLAFSPDGKQIVCGGHPHVINPETGEIVRKLETDRIIVSISYSSDMRRIFGLGIEKRAGEGEEIFHLHAWNVSDGSVISGFSEKDLPEIETEPLPSNVSPDRKHELVLDMSGVIKILERKSNKPVYEFPANESPVLKADYSPHGKYILLLLEKEDGFSISILDSETRKKVQEIFPDETEPSDAVFSPDNNLVLLATREDFAGAYDIRTGKKTLEIKRKPVIDTLAVSADGKFLLSGGFGGKVRLWNVESGTEIESWDSPNRAPVPSVAFFSDGKRFICGGSEALVRNLPDGEIVAKIGDEKSRLDVASVSKDGKYVLGNHELFYAENGKPVRVFGNEFCYDSCFSPDGKSVITGNVKGELVFWDLETGAEIGKPLTFHGFIASLGFSSDGNRFAAASIKQVKVLDMETKQMIFETDIPADFRLRSILLSPDGRFMYARDAHGYQSIEWNLETKELSKRFSGEVFAFGPNGKAMFVLAPNGDIERRE